MYIATYVLVARVHDILAYIKSRNVFTWSVFLKSGHKMLTIFENKLLATMVCMLLNNGPPGSGRLNLVSFFRNA